MSEKTILANGIKLAYEEFGEQSNPAILLIMGLGGQMIFWPESFCRALADNGYRVIRFDNRDIGLSDKIEGVKAPGLLKMVASARLNFKLKVPYDLSDMANDALGLLDALGIDKAHIVGVSMGGMIAQLIAAYFPSRVLSLTSIMSTSGDRSLPAADKKVQRQMMRRPRSKDPQVLLDHGVKTYRMIGSPDYLPGDEELREMLSKSFKRSYYPPGFKRQLAAIIASGDRVDVLPKISVPTLVIHGKVDPLVPVEGGLDTARHIPGAKLELIDGMGHDLPPALMPRLAELIVDHAQCASTEVDGYEHHESLDMGQQTGDAAYGG